MVSPNDIATKEFKRVSSGYSPEEVDMFLDDIYEDYIKLYEESQKKNQAPATDASVQDLRKTLERTLTLAETAAAQVKEAARAEADSIVAQAKAEAEKLLSDSRNQVFEMEQQLATLENRYELMRTRVKMLLYAEIDLIDKSEISSDEAKEVKA